MLSSFLTDLSDQKINFEKEQLKYINNLLVNVESIKSTQEKKTLSLLNELIHANHVFFKEIKEKNKTHSILFNPLSYFPIGETMHSFLLAKLLNPNGEHGQGNLFLTYFMKKLDIEVFEHDTWTVTAETERIDILLKRQHPHTVVVIENKSNYAVDQENQLYRYWYEQIYWPNHSAWGDKTLEHTTNNKHYQIIYLTPADWKIPTQNSLKKPDGTNDFLPDEIPIEPKIWLFKKHIVEWLTDSIQQLHEDNHRLREYIKQYIELWK
jgi:hypothetical protein